LSYLVVKYRKGKPYLYGQHTFRQGGKVRTKNKYFGRFIDQQAGIQIHEGEYYLCEKTTYRRNGKVFSYIDKKRVATMEELMSLQGISVESKQTKTDPDA